MKEIVEKYRQWKQQHPATEFTIRDFIFGLDRHELFLVFEYLDEHFAFVERQHKTLSSQLEVIKNILNSP